jgi:hypothetical protein
MIGRVMGPGIWVNTPFSCTAVTAMPVSGSVLRQTSVVRAGDFPLTRMHGKQIARRGVF